MKGSGVVAQGEWLSLLWNGSLLVALAAMFGLLAEWAGHHRPLGRVATGAAFGLVAVLVMSVPLQVAEGLRYDGRSVVIAMAGLFGGGWPAVIAAGIAAAYRVELGGVGILPGLGTILTSALAGWGLRWWVRGRVTSLRLIHLLAFGLALHLAVLAWQATLPGALTRKVLLDIGPAFLLVFTLATLLLGWMLTGVERRIQDRRRDLEGHLQEITRLHRELEERHRTLEALHRELGLHVSMTAHDLKAPLRAIEGFALALEEIRAPPLPQDARALIGRIANAVNRMGHLIQALEHYGRVVQGAIHPGPVPIRALVDQVLENQSRDPQASKAQIDAEGPEDLVARGDWGLLERVLQNLLSNALLYVRPGEAPQVTIRWRTTETGRVRLEVADRGIGVPQNQRERIFEPYVRLHGREAYPGSGLGLPMVRRAMERLGGRCGVEPRAGGGSVFFVELPGQEDAA